MRTALIRIALAASLVAVATTSSASAPPKAAAATAVKVAIIVGPVGSLTDNYRARGDRVAAAAAAHGATVAKAYSPRATWANVKAAVRDANIIVYFGHGNGFPNPYGRTEWRDRTNGWGLNRTTANGDKDDWSRTLVYCGEKALLGTLGSMDGAAQRKYCAGGPINPAPGFVMIMGQAHYAPGFGERYQRSDPRTTLTQAKQRVRNYSYPFFRLGASAYFGTAYGDAHELVGRLLSRPGQTFGWIFRQGKGFRAYALRNVPHPDFPWKRMWVQRTVIKGFHFGQGDYWYAFSGNPTRTPAGAAGL